MFGKRILEVFLIALVVLGAVAFASRGPAASTQAPGNAGHARFTSTGQHDIQIPIELTAGGHIFVQAKIDASRTLWFILDSGGMNTTISAGIQKELSLRSSAVGSVTGSGEHSEQVKVVDHINIELSGIEFALNNVAAIPLKSLEASFGRRIDGILGYDFISQFVVEIDYAQSLVTIHDPKTFRYAGPGKEFPIQWAAGQPGVVVSVTLPGRQPSTALFHLDTGAGTTIEFYSPYVAAEKLLDAVTRRVRVSGSGVGGDSAFYYGRIASMSIGDLTVANPTAGFSDARGGSMSSTAAAGLIGGKFFRRFKLIIDQSRGRIILEPNRDLSSSDLYDGVGARILAEGADLRSFKVFSLVPDSPAVRSGLRPGDLIVNVDGVPSSKMSIDELRTRLLQGQLEVSLTIRRGQELIELKIKPQPLI